MKLFETCIDISIIGCTFFMFFMYVFHAVVLPDGSFKCKSCEDFVCSGRIPFEQHLVGQTFEKLESCFCNKSFRS
jgi:hypothetical protein